MASVAFLVKIDLVGSTADEPSHGRPGVFVRARGSLGQLVDPTMHVGIAGLVQLGHGVDDLTGALR